MAICEHLAQSDDPQARTPEGCEECLATGSPWVHLRLCLTCGHVGCCDSSPNRHARRHAAADGHPIATQPRLAMTVNAGGGLKVPMNQKMDMRTDARWFKSFGRQGSEQFRVAHGISFDVGRR